MLEWNGTTLLDRACNTALAAGCAPVLRVLGAHADPILAQPCPANVATLVHPAWEEGMGSSLAAGAARLLESAPDLDALLILLPDQPLVTTALLVSLAAASSATASIILCDYGPAIGPPALFLRAHFPELLALSGDAGAKAIAAKHPAALAKLPFPEGASDIDTPEAWNRFIRSRATTPPPADR